MTTGRAQLMLSGTTMRGAPWRVATTVGVAAAGLLLALGVGEGVSAQQVARACSFGLLAMFVVAGVGALLPLRAHNLGLAGLARTWAVRHPWRFGLLPAGACALTVLPVRLALGGEGVADGFAVALARGLTVYLLVRVAASWIRRQRSPDTP